MVYVYVCYIGAVCLLGSFMSMSCQMAQYKVLMLCPQNSKFQDTDQAQTTFDTIKVPRFNANWGWAPEYLRAGKLGLSTWPLDSAFPNQTLNVSHWGMKRQIANKADGNVKVPCIFSVWQLLKESLYLVVQIISEVFSTDQTSKDTHLIFECLELDNHKSENLVKRHSHLEVIKNLLKTISKQQKICKYLSLPKQ